VTGSSGSKSGRRGRRRLEESAPRGPIVLNGIPELRRERVFGGLTPDGPLPGRLLVLLSRLHRAEAGRGPGPAEGTARATPPVT
jgi:hypothetical protein